MVEGDEIRTSDNEISCTKSLSEKDDLNEKKENCLNLNSEAHTGDASSSKTDVDFLVGNSKDECCDRASVKIEERGISVNGVQSTESCLRNKASALTGRYENGALMSHIGRSSTFHGVTRHKWSGKFEAHLWDNTRRIEGHKRKGRQGL